MGCVVPQPQYWHSLAKAFEERPGGGGATEAASVLRDGIRWARRAVELYMTLGRLLEAAGEHASALEVYCSFPRAHRHGEAVAGEDVAAVPSFEQAVTAMSAASLLIERVKDHEHPALADALVTLGRRLGLRHLESHIAALDAADTVKTIREVYTRVLGDELDQTTFFALLGWNYERPARKNSSTAQSPSRHRDGT